MTKQLKNASNDNLNSFLALSKEEKKQRIRGNSMIYTEDNVINNAIKDMENGDKGESTESNIFREMTVREFETGALLVLSFPDMYRTLALSMSKKLQLEFDCQTTSEKSLAEITSLNYCRMLYIQDRIYRYIDKGTLTDIGIGYLKFASQELDRAERHYLTSLQTLKTMREPSMQVNFRANTAVIGQNQVIQVKENEINKTK